MPFFDSIKLLPEDPILSIPKHFEEDTRQHKVNLGIGTYKDSEGDSYVLDCVREAEADLLKKKQTKEYLPIDGEPHLVKLTENLIFGKTFLDSFSGGIYTTQTIGGTGALHLGGVFLSQEINPNIYLPNPTWPNHKLIFNRSGMILNQYRYYDHRTHQFDFSSLCKDINGMPPATTILLHTSCQNPTGIDPTPDQWKALSTLIKKQGVIPFFDFAYQGFKGALDEDAFPIRYFLSEGHELLVAYSFAKNFGLYSDRIGTLSVVTQTKETKKKMESQLKQMIRGNYSNPPRHGAEIISTILESEKLKKMWIAELGNMRDRLKEMRHTLISGLQSKGSDFNWSYLNNQNGFFSFCGLSESQVHQLIKDYAIYMPNNGRINVGGLNGRNMDYVIDAILNITHI